MANDRDPRSDLGAWLGEELRRARLDAGFTSQDQLARELGFDRAVIVKAETGARTPSEDVAPKIAEMFPGLCNGLYVRLAAIARKSNGPIPGWFADWLGREREATSVRIWQPIIVPGLLQTADYAQALFAGERKGIDADALADLVAARIGRQAIFDKPAARPVGGAGRGRPAPAHRVAEGHLGPADPPGGHVRTVSHPDPGRASQRGRARRPGLRVPGRQRGRRAGLAADRGD
jgi:DNA-binding XRE family transcriptional regulator